MKDSTNAMSPARALVQLVARDQGHQMGPSWARYEDAVLTALRLAIRYGLRFDLGDFEHIARKYVVSTEADYALACEGDRYGPNRSACRSFEAWKHRKPFILDAGRRLAVGSRFNWYGEDVTCTSFSDDGGHLVACSYVERSGDQAGRLYRRNKVRHRYTISIADLREHRAARSLWKAIGDRYHKLAESARTDVAHWGNRKFKGKPSTALRLFELRQLEAYVLNMERGGKVRS